MYITAQKGKIWKGTFDGKNYFPCLKIELKSLVNVHDNSYPLSIFRVPCTNKSDSDLPRYKMKWNLPNQTIHQVCYNYGY